MQNSKEPSPLSLWNPLENTPGAKCKHTIHGNSKIACSKYSNRAMQMSISPTTEKAKDTYKKMTIPLGLKLAIKHYFFYYHILPTKEKLDCWHYNSGSVASLIIHDA